MTDKPFASLDYTNEDDVKALFYCCVLANNSESVTYEEFCEIYENPAQQINMLKELERYNSIAAPFISPNETPETNEENIGAIVRDSFIKDTVYTLILSGLDAHYVMHEMELSDLQEYMKAFEQIKREKMESDRFWTYIGMLPHVGKKIKSPKDIVEFEHEKEARQKEAEQNIDQNAGILEGFLNSNYSLKNREWQEN
jgi:hypothetical protein